MKNKSFTYLLPLFCKYLSRENPELNEMLFVTFLDQCYSYKNVNDKLENSYILQIKKPKDRNNIFQKMLSNLKKSSIFAEQKFDNKYFYIYLDIPKTIIKSYNDFINGRFSKICDKNKKIILSFAKTHVNLSFSVEVNQILSKSIEKRKLLEKALDIEISKDTELSSIPNTLSETLKL